MKYVVTLALMAVLIFASQAYAATITVINHATVDLVVEFTGNKMVGPVKVQPVKLDPVKVTKGTTANVQIADDLAVSSYTVSAAGKKATGDIPAQLSVAGKNHTLKAVQKQAGDDVDIDWE